MAYNGWQRQRLGLVAGRPRILSLSLLAGRLFLHLNSSRLGPDDTSLRVFSSEGGLREGS